MENFNFKPMNPDGQFNLDFNKDEKKSVTPKEENKISVIKDEKQELSTEYDLEEEIERHTIERENPSEEYYGRYNKFIEDKKCEEEKPKIEKTKKQLKPKYKHNNNRNFINGPLGPFDPLK